ncbi:hypothetical protein E3N88_36516 [Mikania micrantha]|uniref:Integrase catalytic domain-containing protein n=1 Tax=Mikania micrantha TaxID=192012 RepID=A0A5N6M4Y8_9ASTR|nr:hypothetical protein E3N88_36516 [Mikania micrantha]
MAGSSSSTDFISMNSISHMLTIKLSPTNYLYWKNQTEPLLTVHNLISQVDGTSDPPSPTVLQDTKSVPNPLYSLWLANDKRAIMVFNASLTEEAIAEVIGLSSARSMWLALETAFSNTSIERVQNLRDQLRQITKGSSSVADFGRKFKLICDQLSAAGYPVDDADKNHWFLHGLGAAFESFSTAMRAAKPPTVFRELLVQAESHKLFLKSIHATESPTVAFNSRSIRGGRGGRGGQFRPPSSGGRGRGRRTPHCQLCRQDGHYANHCPTLPSFASQAAPAASDIANAFLAQCHVASSSPDWIADTGATDHMNQAATNLHKSAPFTGDAKVLFGNGNSLPVTHIGSHQLPNNISLNDVLVVPHLMNNLLSVSKLTKDNNLDVLFSQPSFYIQDRTTKQVLAQGRCEDGLYVLKSCPQAFNVIKNKASFEIWHSRLGHVSYDTISMLNKLGCVNLTSILSKPGICNTCEMSKGHRFPFQLNDKRASHCLDLVHCDLWGPSPISSMNNFRYYVIFVDDFSRFTWFYPLQTKSEFFAIFSTFVTFVQTQFSCKIKVFQSDGGTEFLNHNVKNLLNDNGTFHRISCLYTPSQNGRAERKHRHVVETGLALLFNSNLPTSYWEHAFASAVHIINRLPTKVLDNRSPFEVLFLVPPDYTNFHVFGCRVYPYLRDYSEHKLAPRSLPCIFIGYCSQYKGYKCLEPNTGRIFVTRNARFDETYLPTPLCLLLSTTHHPPPLPIQLLAAVTHFSRLPPLYPHPFLQTHPPTSTTQPSPPTIPVTTQTETSPTVLIPIEPTIPSTLPQTEPSNIIPTQTVASTVPQVPSLSPTAPTTTATSSHPMITRAKDGIFKPRHRADLAFTHSNRLLQSLLTTTNPKGVKSASKHSHWIEAMNHELNALYKNDTWVLVRRPATHNVVGSKWLFRTKFRADGSIDRYKARLVAQGYSQVPGLDYSHTFSPVVKATTVRVVLSLAVVNNWKLRQLDVNNAFLHGKITERVFMEQPPGFANPHFPNHVCLLKKAIYGLKQTPRAWFDRLSTFLLQCGFSCSRADASLFVYNHKGCLIYLLVYVDDIIVTGNNDEFISSFVAKLHSEFAIKDLGSLNYFLGLEVTPTDDGLFLSQAKYAHDILSRADLLDCKPVHTPLAPNETLSSAGAPLPDVTSYRSLVGALQYLTITRPDIAYAVNQVSQFLQSPTLDHLQHVKRILRYIKGTMSYGLVFSRVSSPTVLGYSDADWARCIDTRRSTYGYSIYLGNNLISWSAKKQPTVARSSCESEYRAMANTAAEILWVINLLRDLQVFTSETPTLFCDNKSAIFLTQNPVSHKRAKHIDLDYHFIRELVTSGRLRTIFLSSKLQVADIFTKSLPRSQFEHFRDRLCIRPPPFRLREDVNK